MFFLQTPLLADTEVFTQLPQKFRQAGVRSDWADANRAGQATASFPSGASFASTRPAPGTWWRRGPVSPMA
jgi:gluconolactonase